MMRLFLVEKHGARRVDLGTFEFNDVAQCINAAQRRHKFLEKIQSADFEFEGEFEVGPLRHPKIARPTVNQLSLIA